MLGYNTVIGGNIMSVLKKVLKVLAVILIIMVVIVIGYLAYVFISYHRIPDYKDLTIDKRGEVIEKMETDTTYAIMSYNIGFGAYTADYSFFMDGGEYSWAKSEEELKSNIKGIGEDIKKVSPDIVILQEVDLNGTRTYHYNEVEALEKDLGYGNYVFSQNFDSPFLFYPLTQPHGKNQSGLLTGSSQSFTSSLRRSLPISTSVKKIVDLDRCYSITRIPVENGKELCVFDVHLSAYGSDASVREGQLSMLTSDIQKEVEVGNYVICGGDFNHNLRGGNDSDVPDWAQPFPKEILPEGTHLGFDVCDDVDIEHNTCRNSDIAWIPGTTFTVLADGFIVSDNVKVVKYQSLNWDFQRSDHDPIYMEFELLDEE